MGLFAIAIGIGFGIGAWRNMPALPAASFGVVVTVWGLCVVAAYWAGHRRFSQWQQQWQEQAQAQLQKQLQEQKQAQHQQVLVMTGRARGPHEVGEGPAVLRRSLSSFASDSAQVALEAQKKGDPAETEPPHWALDVLSEIAQTAPDQLAQSRTQVSSPNRTSVDVRPTGPAALGDISEVSPMPEHRSSQSEVVPPVELDRLSTVSEALVRNRLDDEDFNGSPNDLPEPQVIVSLERDGEHVRLPNS